MGARLPTYEGHGRVGPAPVPEDDPAAPIRDRLAAERQQLDAVNPEALELAGRMLYQLHGLLRGEVAELAPRLGRSPRYLRGELLGEKGLPLEDLCALRMARPAAVSFVLAPLARIGEAEEVPVRIGEAGAELARAAGDFLARLLVGLEDGVLTLAELRPLAQALDLVEQSAREARIALMRRGGL